MNGKKINNRYIIFGGTGDLAYRKLMPAFYNMYVRNELTDDDCIVVVGRKDYTNNDYYQIIEKWIKENARLLYTDEKFKKLTSLIKYFKMTITDIDQYQILKEQLPKANKTIAYEAVAPKFFKIVSEGLASCNFDNVNVVIEKPFGENVKEIEDLYNYLVERFSKKHIYFIDHYLGKEMVRNILTVRCANPLFENAWNSKFIEKVEINAFEKVGVENRASYYDHAGALKDMVQNHLLQLLTIVALDNPSDIKSMKKQQLEVLNSLYYKDIKDSMILGQYEGYRNEIDVAKDSKTETFAALKLYINSKKWENVPFIISTGKKLNERMTEVRITFRSNSEDIDKNVLTIKIQPMEGIELNFNIKTPGVENEISSASLDFCQSCIDVNRINTPEAYEWMLGAIKNDDQYWFSEFEQIKVSYSLIEKMKNDYDKNNPELYNYNLDIKSLIAKID